MGRIYGNLSELRMARLLEQQNRLLAAQGLDEKADALLALRADGHTAVQEARFLLHGAANRSDKKAAKATLKDAEIVVKHAETQFKALPRRVRKAAQARANLGISLG